MTMEPHPNAQVYDSAGSTFWFNENGIVCFVTKNTPLQTLGDIINSFNKFKEIIGTRKVCVLLDITNSAEITREVRNYMASELPEFIIAIALISKTAFGKMLASIFLSISSQPYPTKNFVNEKDALKWLQQYV
ncbi:MAG: hypothetical protein V4608_01695 [Bacteroidota bacterium]